MAKAPSNPLAAQSEKRLAATVAKLFREGRMPAPGRLADALAGAARVGEQVRLKLQRSREGAPYNRVFVSSSQREGSTVNQARAGLRSPEFENLVVASHRLPGVEGGKNALGFWSDGAEESRIVNVSDPAALSKVAASLAKAFRQKAVLHFRSGPDGQDVAHVLTIPSDDAKDIADRLGAHGIEYKTIAPDHEARTSEVHIIDGGGELTPQVEAFAKETGAHHARHIGTATFLGAESREDADRLYDGILRK